MDAIAGKPKWSATDKKCEECNGEMVQLDANNYVCTKCGLTQVHAVKLRYIANPKDSTADSSTSELPQQINERKTSYEELLPFSQIICSLCGKKFESEDALKQHDRMKHHEP